MATTTRSLRDEIRSHNAAADRLLQTRVGMSFRTFKVIKALSQLAGVGAGIYAMSLGADPMTALVIVGAIYAGPEAVEVVLMQGSDGD